MPDIAYIYLIFSIFSSVTFIQLIRGGQLRKKNMHAIIAVNYLIAAAINGCIVVVFASARQAATPAIILLGVGNGILFSTHLYILLGCFRKIGVGVTSAVTSMGILFTIFYFWLFKDTPISPLQWAAMFLVVPTMILVRQSQSGSARFNWKTDLLLVSNFVMGGTIGILHKTVSDMDPTYASFPVYLACLFTVAAALTTTVMVRKKQFPDVGNLLYGGLIGIINVLGNHALIRVLSMLPPIIVFPTGQCSAIVLNNIFAALFWKERPMKRQYAGVALAIAIVLLVNL